MSSLNQQLHSRLQNKSNLTDQERRELEFLLSISPLRQQEKEPEIRRLSNEKPI